MEDEQWQQICQQVKQTIPGTPQEQEDILRRRLLRFFGNSSLEQSRFYVPRREIVRNPLLSIQQNSLILYGIDFLSSHRLEAYLAPASPEVAFLDDSHCALLFSDETRLIAALFSRLLSPNVDAATFEAKLLCSPTMKLEWMELQPYIEMGLQRRMWARFLTSQDLEDGEAKNRAFLETYLHAKQQFLSNMQRFSQDSLLPKNYNSRSRSRESQRNNNSSWGNNSARTSNKVGGSCQCPCLENHLVNSLKEIRSSRRDQGSPYQRNYRASERARHHQHHHQHNYRSESNNHPNDFKEQIVPNIPKASRLPTKSQTIAQRAGFSPYPQTSGQQQNRSAQQKQQRMIASLLEELEKYKFDSDEPSFDKFVSRGNQNNRSNSDFSVFEFSEQP